MDYEVIIILTMMVLMFVIGLIVGFLIPRPGETVDECRRAYEAGREVGRRSWYQAEHPLGHCPSERTLVYREGYQAALDSREGD